MPVPQTWFLVPREEGWSLRPCREEEEPEVNLSRLLKPLSLTKAQSVLTSVTQPNWARVWLPLRVVLGSMFYLV